ncbi:hypothetical protein, partial [Laspinema olomoucense]|uniref:hypothetical protein n=1 Tax=Laspinema olomoucense TaxID=3231600 RepID=UPI0021BA7AA3
KSLNKIFAIGLLIVATVPHESGNRYKLFGHDSIPGISSGWVSGLTQYLNILPPRNGIFHFYLFFFLLSILFAHNFH